MASGGGDGRQKEREISEERCDSKGSDLSAVSVAQNEKSVIGKGRLKRRRPKSFGLYLQSPGEKKDRKEGVKDPIWKKENAPAKSEVAEIREGVLGGGKSGTTL